MTTYKEPTQTEFNSAEDLMIKSARTAVPDAILNAGSAIRELIVRPFSYLFAWAERNLRDIRNESSISVLLQSQLTENAVADAVASNYFTERKAASRSRGSITLTLSSPSLRIDRFNMFNIAGETVRCPYTYIISGSTPGTDTDTVRYIQSYAGSTQGVWIATIGVEASTEGPIEIEDGEEAYPLFSTGYITGAILSSALTGGSDTETDAEMITRAKYAVADTAVGSYNGIYRKLQNAPVSVSGMSIIAGEDIEIHRARYNEVGINPGGLADLYVRTQDQASSEYLDASEVSSVSGQSDVTITAVFSSNLYAGIYSVLGVVADGVPVQTYSVEFFTDEPGIDDAGARLSCAQKVRVVFTLDSAPSTVRAFVSYMPGLYQLQEFLNSDYEKFIGQDIRVKAAVPITVKLRLSIKDGYSADSIETMRAAICRYVNSIRPGTRTLNFSDIRNACYSVLSEVELRLPAIIQASTILKDGTTTAWFSNTGVLDIDSVCFSQGFDHRVCFFSLIPSGITFEVI